MIIKRNIIFNLQSKKENGKVSNENLSIRMRVNYGGQRVDFTTGYRIDLDKWDLTKQRVINKSINKLQQTASDINSHLDKLSFITISSSFIPVGSTSFIGLFFTYAYGLQAYPSSANGSTVVNLPIA